MALRVIALALALVALARGQTIDFDEVPAPATIEFVTRTATMAYIDGNPYPIKYKPLLEQGRVYPGFDGKPWKVGTVLDKNGVPLTAADHPEANPATAGNNFDKTSIFVKFNRIWAITQDEASFGNYYMMRLQQDPTDGTLVVAQGRSLELGSIYGSLRPCSGSVTPWLSHLAGEENVIEGRNFPPASTNSALQRQAVFHRLSSWNQVNPYWYSWYVEISVTTVAGGYNVKKRYAMGRANWETAVALGDNRTFLCTDDTSNGGVMTLFVADRPRDLSCGKLFAAKPNQLSAVDGGSFTIEWIPLNNRESVCESTVAAAIAGPTYNDAPVKFADLFEVATPVFLPSGLPDLSQLPAGFREVRSVGSRYEWLKLKPGMGALASTMETARMAAYVGASTEFTKLEGASYDALRREVYVAFTAIQRSMLDNVYPTATYPNSLGEFGGINAIRLPQNIPGAIHRMSISSVARVSLNTPVTMHAILNSFGAPNAADNVNNSVPADSIASPDNVSIMAKYRTLLIGEDCDVQHANNFMWAYNVNTNSLKRIMTAPYDAEVTSPYYFKNIGAFSYMTATIQHPNVARDGIPCTMGYWALPAEA